MTLTNDIANVDALGASLVGQRILVTGATGFIGTALTHRLWGYGVEVIAHGRKSSNAVSSQQQGVEFIYGDITDFPHMDLVISQNIDIVYHLAAWLRGSSRRDALLTNVAATEHLAYASAHNSVKRFIYVSSIAVYGPHGDLDVDEDSESRFYGDPYGDSKILAERTLRKVAQSTKLATTVIRPGMVYGPGSPGWTKRMGYWAKSGRLPIIDSGRGTAYPVFIENLVDLLILCAARPVSINQTYNAVDDGPVTLGEFEGAFLEMAGTHRAIRLAGWIARILASVADPFSPGISYRYVVSQMRGRGLVLNQKAKEQLGWIPRVTLAEGLRRSEEWLRSEGIL